MVEHRRDSAQSCGEQLVHRYTQQPPRPFRGVDSRVAVGRKTILCLDQSLTEVTSRSVTCALRVHMPHTVHRRSSAYFRATTKRVMDDRSSPSRSPSLSPQTLSKGRNNLAGGTAAQSTAGATTTTATTAAAAAAETGRMDTPSQSRPTSASGVAAFDHRVALSRPRRSWDTAFLASAGSSNGGGGGDNTNDSAAGMFRPRPPGRTSHSATTAPAGAAGVAGSSGAGGWSSPGASTSGITITTAEREERGREDLADATPGGRAREGGSRGEDAAAPCDGFSGGAGGGASYFSRSTKPREPAAVVACSVAIPPTDVGSSPAPASPPTSSSSSSSPRAGGVAGSDDDLTDTDEGVSESKNSTRTGIVRCRT